MESKQARPNLHAMDFFLGDLELTQCNVESIFTWLHVHGRRHKALLSRDVSMHWLVAGCIQVIFVLAISGIKATGGTAVQGSWGLVIQVLVRWRQTCLPTWFQRRLKWDNELRACRPELARRRMAFCSLPWRGLSRCARSTPPWGWEVLPLWPWEALMS